MSGEADGVTKSDSESAAAGEGADALRAQITELEGRLRQVSAAYKQKADEIESTKSRLERNAALREEIRRGEIVSALFDPVENLHRSIQSVASLPEAAHGLAMVHAQFMTALRGLGLEEVGVEGERFDPNSHEAILTQPVAEAGKDGTVLSVFSLGYRIGRNLIRPARVVIGAYTAPAGEA